ncbi:hypothetical protein BHM03_00044826 [Ensete ventricosum]|nr:hypothetical protein BHM03_00044826 [Ensete ventricosum]
MCNCISIQKIEVGLRNARAELTSGISSKVRIPICWLDYFSATTTFDSTTEISVAALAAQLGELLGGLPDVREARAGVQECH